MKPSAPMIQGGVPELTFPKPADIVMFKYDSNLGTYMKHIVLVLIVSLSFFSSPVWSEESIALLKNISGTATILRHSDEISAQKGLNLLRTDTLITKADSYAGIIFNDGTTFSVGPNTEFDINSYRFEPDKKSYDFSVYLKKGSIIYGSGRIGKLSPESIQISTPRATVSVRGTRFIVTVD